MSWNITVRFNMAISLNNQFNTEIIKRFYCPTYIVNSKNALDLQDYVPGFKPVVVIHDAFINPDEYIECDLRISVAQEPTEEMVDSAIGRLPAGEIIILAIGGGSAIDLAKAIVAYKKFGMWRGIGYGEYRYLTDQQYEKCFFIAAPTTPATGSEVSRYFLIKDSVTSEKLVGRAWAVCPDVAFISPVFLRTLPVKKIVAAAFDAFIHVWEVYFCRYESSAMTRLLAAEAMSEIFSAISSLNLYSEVNELPDEILEPLQRAATLGGMCISNTRTGLLHTAGEALSAQVNIAHPFTLRIFFNTSLIFYKKHYEERIIKLSKYFPEDIKSLDDIMGFWDYVWWNSGLEGEIRSSLNNCNIDLYALEELIKRDQVLLKKEHLIEIDDDLLTSYLSVALGSYKISHS
jgi:alcohol dehydrogenase class IV